MILSRIERYLSESGVPYRVLHHSRAVSAQATAEAEGVSGWQVAKAVAVELDSGDELICVVPAPMWVDLDAVEDCTGATDVELVAEPRLHELFPGCEAGAAPPFGGLWNLPLVVDPAIRRIDHLLVKGGSHDTLIVLATEDFLHLERPRLFAIGVMPGQPWAHALPQEPGLHPWDRS